MKYKWSLLWLCFILLLTFIPKHDIPDLRFSIRHVDKLVHFSFYFILIILFLKESKNVVGHPATWIGFSCAVLLGIATEYAQSMMHLGRSFEWYDMAANVAGSIMGMFFFKVLLKDRMAKQS